MTPCPHCGTTVRHTTKVGCCSGCGELFSGDAAFDAHRVGTRSRSCLSPETAVHGPGGQRQGERIFRPLRAAGMNKHIWGLNPSEKQAERFRRLNEQRKSA